MFSLLELHPGEGLGLLTTKAWSSSIPRLKKMMHKQAQINLKIGSQFFFTLIFALHFSIFSCAALANPISAIVIVPKGFNQSVQSVCSVSSVNPVSDFSQFYQAVQSVSQVKLFSHFSQFFHSIQLIPSLNSVDQLNQSINFVMSGRSVSQSVSQSDSSVSQFSQFSQ